MINMIFALSTYLLLGAVCAAIATCSAVRGFFIHLQERDNEAAMRNGTLKHDALQLGMVTAAKLAAVAAVALFVTYLYFIFWWPVVAVGLLRNR
jgi:hypothetical protein